MLNCAWPLRDLHIDRPYAQAMALRIFYQHRRHVKTHWLIVEYGAGERSQITHLEISRSISNERKAGGMRFREAIERERGNVLNNIVLGGSIETVLGHARPQLHLQLLHTLPRASHANGTAQLLCFRTRKISHRHGYAQELFLEQRGAQGPFGAWLQGGVGIS